MERIVVPITLKTNTVEGHHQMEKALYRAILHSINGYPITEDKVHRFIDNYKPEEYDVNHFICAIH